LALGNTLRQVFEFSLVFDHAVREDRRHIKKR
jgi:hypothetical protein